MEPCVILQIGDLKLKPNIYIVVMISFNSGSAAADLHLRVLSLQTPGRRFESENITLSLLTGE